VDLPNVRRDNNMFIYNNLLGTITSEITWSWEAITAIAAIAGFIATIIGWINSKASKKDLEIMKAELKEDIIDLDRKNIGSHAEIRAESDKYLEIIRDELKADRDGVDKKLDIVLEMIRDIKRTG
jgi:hypothetical protein